MTREHKNALVGCDACDFDTRDSDVKPFDDCPKCSPCSECGAAVGTIRLLFDKEGVTL